MRLSQTPEKVTAPTKLGYGLSGHSLLCLCLEKYLQSLSLPSSRVGIGTCSSSTIKQLKGTGSKIWFLFSNIHQNIGSHSTVRLVLLHRQLVLLRSTFLRTTIWYGHSSIKTLSIVTICTDLIFNLHLVGLPFSSKSAPVKDHGVKKGHQLSL